MTMFKKSLDPLCTHAAPKVSKGAKFRNQYNQVRPLGHDPGVRTKISFEMYSFILKTHTTFGTSIKIFEIDFVIEI